MAHSAFSRSSFDQQIEGQPVILTAAEGSVEILPLPGGRFKVTLNPQDSSTFIPRRSCETSLPPDVIAAFLEVSFTWLCDSLARHEEPEYVQGVLAGQLLAYVAAADFRGKRLLDFGCGSGASTFFLGAAFPETEVVGVELSAVQLALANRVLAARPLANVRFLLSPDPVSLPPAIGIFDFVMLSAVYEHLLPAERCTVMPLIWSSLKPGGTLFINQTPYRYFPVETHSTGLWFINYLPDRLSLLYARKCAGRDSGINRSQNWAVHLRGGVRGGTEAEVLRNLNLAGTGRPVVLQPLRQNRAAYWLSCTNPRRYRLIKKFIAAIFRLTDRLWGTIPSTNLDVVIRKDSAQH